MLIPYTLLFSAIILDVYLLTQILFIRFKGEIIHGKIVGKKYYNDEGVQHYFDIIEYRTTDGENGTTKARIRQKEKERGFGKTVELYQYNKRGKIEVEHLTIYFHKLYGSLLFTAIILGYIIVATT